MLGLLKQIGELYVKQFLLTICLVAGAGVLLCLYMASGARLMSDRELAQRLEEMYGRDFVILTGRKLEEAERAEGVWRAKVWQVAPAEEPERRFWAYNIVSGGGRRGGWGYQRLAGYLWGGYGDRGFLRAGGRAGL